MVNSQQNQSVNHHPSQPGVGRISIPPTIPFEQMPPSVPTTHTQNPRAWSIHHPPRSEYPSFIDHRWYFSESIRQSARDLHSRVYIPPTSAPNPDRFDAMFRPIITTSIEWSEDFGPYLAIRMWRWTGWFAPYKQGLVVEKFLGRFGLRNQKTKEPTPHALVLHKLLTGLPRLKMRMIKLPPSGIAKLLVPTAISSVYHTELLLEGNGIEIIPSAIYEMNLNYLTSGGRVRNPASPLILLRLPPHMTSISEDDFPREDAYDPHTLPIPIIGPLPKSSSNDLPDVPTNYPLAGQALPQLCRRHVSPSETILATPAGGDVHLESAVNEDRTVRIGGRPRPTLRLG